MNKKIKHSLEAAWVWVLLMLITLPILAGLQYYWLGKISEAEKDRMQKNLVTTVNRFNEAFSEPFGDVQVLPLNLTFWSGKPPSVASRIALNYKKWSQKTAYPNLLKHIYKVIITKDEAYLFQLSLKHEAIFKHIDWKNNNTKWIKLLDEPDVIPEYTPLLLEEAPVLFLPYIDPTSIKDIAQPLARVVDKLPEWHPEITHQWIVLELDKAVIEQELLPDLMTEYFPHDYDVSVRMKDAHENLLFNSNPSLTAQHFEKADIIKPLMRRSAFRDIFINVLSEASPDSTHIMISRDSLSRDATLKLDFLKADSFQVHAKGEFNFTENGNMNGITLFRTQDSFENKGFNPNENWEIVVKHKAGSLENAVTQTRYQNLGISLGIFILLLGSVLLLIRATHKAQQTAQQQMEFVAGVSHELRTPLAVIHAAGENLADGLIQDPETTTAYGKLIRDEGRRLTDMVEEILALAGVQSGKRTYHKAMIDIREPIQKSIESTAIEQQGFTLHTTLPEKPVFVLGDRLALQSCIENLLNNAIKYSLERKNIWLELDRDTTRNLAQIRVRDEGMGIPSEEIGQIFNPFYRGQKATSQQIRGTGLGLSLVHHIIEFHQGKILVESNPHEGSTFTILLPFAQNPVSNL